jgi:hypothetical protein
MKISQIQNYVENYTELDLTTNTRERNHVYARAVYFYLCKKYTKTSIVKIAKSVGRHHAAVIHSMNNTIEEVFMYDQGLKALCDNFTKVFDERTFEINETKVDIINENVDIKNELAFIKSSLIYKAMNKIPDGKVYKVLDFIEELSNEPKINKSKGLKEYAGYSSVDAY